MDYNIDMHWDESAGVWCAVCDSIPLTCEDLTKKFSDGFN